MDQTIAWLRGLAEKGGKGVVNNIDARCLGRIADDLERLRWERDGWHEDFKTLGKTLVGNTGLSAITEATRLRKLHPLT